jgi:hypothetical protein
MALPIFGKESQAKYMGSFRTTEGTVITFGGANLVLLQNLQVSHQQPITPLFEVGSNSRYYVVGKASGTFSASQVLGLGSAALEQVTSLADPCSLADRTLRLMLPSSFCPSNKNTETVKGSLELILEGVLLSSVGFTIAAQDNLINSQVQGNMTDLTYEYK